MGAPPILGPLHRALVPVDSQAAEQVSAPNYDEYLNDLEVFREIRRRPACVLTVTMAHCAVDSPEAILKQDSPEALHRAGEGFRALAQGPLVRRISNAYILYEIVDPERTGVRQIGLGGMALTTEIRTEDRPGGRIVRNEGIREEKARGRARLIEATGSIIGTVNLAVEDRAGLFASTLEGVADRRPADLEATDDRGCIHRIWIVPAGGETALEVEAALAREPEAYVADGNHRSAAAAMLGLHGFPAVVFPAPRMGLAPYNRLVAAPPRPRNQLMEELRGSFDIQSLPDIAAYSPAKVNEIGLLDPNGWLRLTPKPGSLQGSTPGETIDAAIVQRRIFEDVLGIGDPRDERLTFVGGNRDAAWLEEQVRSGAFGYAVSLAPVTMEQFLDVCRAGEFMPPKSTWFQPKLRMGLFVVELER